MAAVHLFFSYAPTTWSGYSRPRPASSTSNLPPSDCAASDASKQYGSLRAIAEAWLWRFAFLVVLLGAGYPLEVLNTDESFAQAAFSENLGSDEAPAPKQAIPHRHAVRPTTTPTGELRPVRCWPAPDRSIDCGTIRLRAITRIGALAHTATHADAAPGDPA